MSLDSVQTSLSKVHPGQDAHDDRGPDPRQQANPRRQRNGQTHPDEPRPVPNDLGQTTGQTINITA